MSGIKLRGFKKDGEKKEVKVAPLEIKEIQPQQEEFLDIKPSPITTAVREMFRKPTVSKPETSTKPIVETPVVEEEKVVVKKEVKPVSLDEILEEDYDEAIKKLGKLIVEEDKGDPYVNEVPEAYVPQSRRGFSEFIKENYSEFMLKPIKDQEPVKPGDKYLYQKFVREYIRNSSPYKGILVYHGLGSGKTCSAIAASEALFSTAHKKIIVMTPFSLRKNFLREITFCGFKHYRLQNYWVSLDKSNPLHVLFAEKILNVSKLHLKTARHIWVPDFEQEPNYNSLSSDDQTEIRKQILSSLVYDRVKNPTGRIHFINYNGISAKRLKEIACKEPNFFDDAVIVIDEIHNLVRLMTGKIEPYVVFKPKVKRRIVQEVIGVDKWKPSLCLTARNYSRGYLFYRLLLSCTNTKIIGLSGTPLINFPEELGILANILHGYIPVMEGIVAVTGEENKERIERLLLDYQYIDFVRVESDRTGSGIRFTVSLLPDNIRKISNDVGVERIPEGVDVPTKQEILNEVTELFTNKGFSFSMKPQYTAKPLLPITHEEYENYFLEGVGNLKNKAVLLKRLTGIVSYYRGSRQDLMPKVAKDEIVRCPFSEYQQNLYMAQRTEEVERQKSKKSTKSAGAIWSEVFELAQGKASTSYRMGSRQLCNFAFPPQVNRPRPRSQKDVDIEASEDRDINETTPDLPADAEEMDEQFPEIEEDIDDVSSEQIEAEEADALGSDELNQTGGADDDYEYEILKDEIEFDEVDDLSDQEGIRNLQRGGDSDDEGEENISGMQRRIKKAISRKTRELLAQRLPEGSTEEEALVLKKQIKKELKKKLARSEITLEDLEKPEKPVTPETLIHDDELRKPVKTEKKVMKVKSAKQAVALLKEQKQSDCKAGQKSDETYRDAIVRSKQCLVEFASDNLRLDNPQGLSILSSKFAAMLRNIQDAPGSSLVYSQFLDMEGIGIFRIVMDINGYSPIEIVPSDEGGYQFSERTVESFKKGALQPRYITFSGAEAEDLRKLGLDVFNARFNELPEKLSKVLLENGFNDNKRGQICRVFCITSAGAEGLSLKNVRAVHLMEPYWNEVRNKQVKGRAIRIGSHLELPPEDRNVSIYTYVSVFSEEAQKAKAGPMKISATISGSDTNLNDVALKLGIIKVDSDIRDYVLTSDEYLLTISFIKKRIMDELETIMKSSAIDCELNYAENRDGTFRCLPLKGKVGDFLYHPDIQTDIRESESMFELAEKKEERKFRYIKYKGKRYAVESKEENYNVFDPENLEEPIGTMAKSESGEPSLPISLY